MGYFLSKQLTTYYFHKKVISKIFDIDLNKEAVTHKCSVKKCSYKFREIYSKTPVLESFNVDTMAYTPVHYTLP